MRISQRKEKSNSLFEILDFDQVGFFGGYPLQCCGSDNGLGGDFLMNADLSA